MLIVLAVIAVWSTLGCAASLWLTLLDWRCGTRDAVIVGAVCGPGVWLFVLTVFIADQIDQRKRGR